MRNLIPLHQCPYIALNQMKKKSEVSSRRTPTMIENQVPEQLDEVHSSPTTNKNQSERHSQVQQEEEDLLNYNIDEIFEAFTFHL